MEVIELAPSVRNVSIDAPRNPHELRTSGDNQQLPVAGLTELVAGLAHEVRNPLSTVMVNLKLLAETLDDDRTPAEVARRRAAVKVELLRNEAERLKILFDNFLKLTGPAGLDRKDQDVNAVVRRVIEFFEPQASAAGCNIELVLEPQKLICQVDELMLRQALLNIMLNAVQAMDDGGTLTVSTEADEDCVYVRMADTGPGIPEDERERILKPFHSTKPRGSGLGLSITDRIVREHGGTLTFVSEPGRGTTFTIQLPRSRRDRTATD